MDSRQLHVLVELNNSDLRIGAVNDALDLAELTSPRAARFTLCGPLTDQFCAEAEKRGAATLRATSMPYGRRDLPLYAIDVMRWVARLRQLRPDVVHLNYASYGPSLACAARICRIPVVARSGPFIPGNLSNRWISTYIANCQAHAAELLASPIADRVVVTGDLFRPDRVRTTMTPERTLPERTPGSARIVFLGQLVERKGLHVLVEAFARMRQPSELLMAGGDWSEAGYPQRIKGLAGERGVMSRIYFENHRSDVGAVLRTADIFVLPSFSEARPRTIIEAMSLGVPVVASAVGGVPSMIVDQENGMLVPPGDPVALCAALDELAGSPVLRARIGKAGRVHMERHCRADRTAADYLRVYRELATA